MIGCKYSSCEAICSNKFIIEIKNCNYTKTANNSSNYHLSREKRKQALSFTLTVISELELIYYRIYTTYSLIVATFNQYFDEKTGLYFERCSSFVEYPDRDEAVDFAFKKDVFHVRIYHPVSLYGPHFSSPFFWVSTDKHAAFNHFVSAPSHVGALKWHSIKGYFFSLKDDIFSGFFLEDGFDNWNSGSSGLIFIYNGKESSSWYWEFDIDPDSHWKVSNKKRGQ
ncbi:hypothetical protein KKF34_14960 [Myxococcota bacterium]|nr:hypothetical protein [Myxococcota bacterium]MBU1383036.1 hypothetical protein [Myxococcota bacterium]MBU1498176.1 hypothetical protein [Myxococcota bacterium]